MLFPDLRPVAAPPSIDLRCCDVREMLVSVRGARLIVADPPWQYSPDMWKRIGATGRGTEGAGAHSTVYDCLSNQEIVEILDAAYDSAGPDARLACWYTWPKDDDWAVAGNAGPRWGKRVTGGCWVKHFATSTGSERRGSPGVGHHWRGESEPVAVFTRGACGRAQSCIPNAHVGPLTEHSEKPAEWMRQWIEAWTDPGDLVVDVFAGLAPLARACALSGRRYVGAEIDPDRHALALTRLAASISRGSL